MALLPQLANTPLETPLVLQLRGYFTGSLLFKYSVRRDARTFLATMSHVVGISQGGRIQRCLSTHGCSARYMQRNIPPCRWVPQAVSATPCFRPSWKEWKCVSTINMRQFRKTCHRGRAVMEMCSVIPEVHQQQPQVSPGGLKDEGMELKLLESLRNHLFTTVIRRTVPAQTNLEA